MSSFLHSVKVSVNNNKLKDLLNITDHSSEFVSEHEDFELHCFYFSQCMTARVHQRLYLLLWGKHVSNNISGDAETASKKTCNDDCVGKKKQKNNTCC